MTNLSSLSLKSSDTLLSPLGTHGFKSISSLGSKYVINGLTKLFLHTVR
jgi:hypothetical protein